MISPEDFGVISRLDNSGPAQKNALLTEKPYQVNKIYI